MLCLSFVGCYVLASYTSLIYFVCFSVLYMFTLRRFSSLALFFRCYAWLCSLTAYFGCFLGFDLGCLCDEFHKRAC